MRRLRLTDQAVDDLVAIAEYIADQSGHAEIGESFAAEIEGHCQKLASLPGLLGRSRPEIRPDIRSVPHKAYIIFFRYRDQSLEVVTIVNSARDIDLVFDRLA